MKRKSVALSLGVGNCIKFLILSFTISAMLMFSSGSAVWAQGEIVFMSKRDGNAEIYSMNADGSEQVNLTMHHAEDYDPVWSPDGKQILFSSNRGRGVFDLYVMDADGANVQKVFANSKYRRYPDWSSDGKKIVYAQGEPRLAKLLFGFRFVPSTELTLYIATINGGSVEKLTDGSNPSWSPDGQEIAFEVRGRKDLPLGIFDMQTHTKKTLLSREMPRIVEPSWSPGGDKIAFAEIDGGFNAQGFLSVRKSTIYVVNRNGTGLHQITEDEEKFASDPTWSPEGNTIIYSKVSGGRQLYKTDVKNGNTIQLTHEGSNSWPDWFNPTNLSVSSSMKSLTTMWGKLKQN